MGTHSALFQANFFGGQGLFKFGLQIFKAFQKVFIYTITVFVIPSEVRPTSRTENGLIAMRNSDRFSGGNVLAPNVIYTGIVILTI